MSKPTDLVQGTLDFLILRTVVLTAQKLTLKTNPQPGRTAAFDSCELTVGNQKMVGTVRGGDAGRGTIEFVRIKP